MMIYITIFNIIILRRILLRRSLDFLKNTIRKFYISIADVSLQKNNHETRPLEKQFLDRYESYLSEKIKNIHPPMKTNTINASSNPKKVQVYKNA